MPRYRGGLRSGGTPSEVWNQLESYALRSYELTRNNRPKANVACVWGAGGAEALWPQ